MLTGSIGFRCYDVCVASPRDPYTDPVTPMATNYLDICVLIDRNQPEGFLHISAGLKRGLMTCLDHCPWDVI